MLACAVACSNSKGNGGKDNDPEPSGMAGSPSTMPTSTPTGAPTSTSTAPPSTTPTIPVPKGGIPAPEAETTLTLADAPALGVVKYVPNRSSVRLYLPGVEGAKDYRVFAVEDGVKVSVDAKREHVQGGTLTCAGLRQRNQCDNGEKLPIVYNNELLDMPTCEQYPEDRRPNVPTQLMQTLEVDGVKETTTLVVEAIDRQCPFPGLFGTRHEDVKIANVDIGGPTVQAIVNNKSYMVQLLPKTFPLRTEAEIREQYGSMILNGQGPNQPTLDPSSPAFPESPYIRVGQPAPADDPIVLARAVVKVTPTGNATLPDGFTEDDYFDDFDDDTDQPKLLRSHDLVNDVLGGQPVKVYLTKKWVLYDDGNEYSDFFIDRGQLNMSFGDTAQDSMTNQAMYPRRPVQLPTAPDTYLHVTYEVQRNETGRRYENLTLCGSDQKGQTYDGDTPRAAPTPRPGFMNETDTSRTSVLGWNCLYLIPRGGGYYALPGGDVKSHADTSLKISIIRSQPAPLTPADYDVKIASFATAFGPTLEPPSPLRWLRQLDSGGNPVGVWLDDQMNVWQRTRFDVFIRRDRVVFYVEGEQRICQELDPSLMTMAEGALGFWHVLYHSSAEFTEMRRGLQGDNPQTGQHHIMHNTPFADQRSYDNVGFRENVKLPDDFDPSVCYKAK